MNLELAPLRRALPAVLAACVAQNAVAQAGPVSARVCRSDAIKFCSDVEPGGGRAMACLESHKGKLSSACLDALPLLGSCAQELRKHCDKAEGAAAMQACAREHAALLSPKCQAVLP